MRILVLIVAIAQSQGFHSQGFFRTRLNGNRHRLDDAVGRRFQSIKSLNVHHLNGHCSQPCQRQPYFVKFDSVMKYGNIQKLIGRSIRPRDGQHMIDIGICSGFCKKFQSFLYIDIPVSPRLKSRTGNLSICHSESRNKVYSNLIQKSEN